MRKEPVQKLKRELKKLAQSAEPPVQEFLAAMLRRYPEFRTQIAKATRENGLPLETLTDFSTRRA